MLDWSSQNVLAVGLGASVYMWNAGSGQVFKLCDLSSQGDLITSVAWSDRVSLHSHMYITLYYVYPYMHNYVHVYNIPMYIHMYIIMYLGSFRVCTFMYHTYIYVCTHISHMD